MRVKAIRVELSVTANPGNIWVKAGASSEAELEPGDTVEGVYSALWHQVREQVSEQINLAVRRNTHEARSDNTSR